MAFNVRVIGEPDVVIDKAKQLWNSGMKVVIATYCKTAAEHREVYEQIHAIA